MNITIKFKKLGNLIITKWTSITWTDSGDDILEHSSLSNRDSCFLIFVIIGIHSTSILQLKLQIKNDYG